MSSSFPTPRDRLIEIFVQWNEKINLSAIRTPSEIYEKHILDSLELNQIIDLATGKLLSPRQDAAGAPTAREHPRLLDLGTGGGFPLLPLAITNTTVQCVGLDSTRKKLTAVQAIADELEVKNLTTIRSRAEDHHQTYQIVTARAVGYADKLFPRALPLLAPNGLLCLYKQLTVEEDDLILGLVREHNLELIELHHYRLPNDEKERVLYVMKK